MLSPPDLDGNRTTLERVTFLSRVSPPGDPEVDLGGDLSYRVKIPETLGVSYFPLVSVSILTLTCDNRAQAGRMSSAQIDLIKQ